MEPSASKDVAHSPSNPQGAPDEAFIAVVSQFIRELHPRSASARAVALSSRLEQDLGVDSLARTELILRIERAFRRRLPNHLAAEAETVEDLFRALGQAADRTAPGARAAAPAPSSALPSVSAPQEVKTLVEALDWHAARHPDRLHLTLLQDDETTLAAMTYGELAASARRVAAGLIERDILPGDRVAIMLPTSAEFFSIFFGTLYAGAVPVPIYPPVRLSQIEDHLRRQAAILSNAGARLLATVPEGRNFGALLQSLVDSLTSVETAASLASASGEFAPQSPADEKSTALLQYTSGSTGAPKGVVLSHANLLANIRAMGRVMDANSDDVFVSWLPLYHDMGLIGAWLGCLYFAARLYVMSPLSFLTRPECWLWAIHRYRATLSASPNFGFELCLDKVEDSSLQGLDLSSLRMVANGAEPVSAATIRRFADRFSHYGFQPGAMAPVYGLAENSVGLAFPPLGRTPVIDRIDRAALGRRGLAAPSKAEDAHPLEIVACGQPLPGHEIRVVDDFGREVGERQEGHVEFRGPSAASGYFRNEAKTRDLLRGGWLDTGDDGYMAGGDIHITGRVKDIIIRAGQHIFPQEIEEAVGRVPGIRKGCVAAFGVADPASGTERVVVMAETRETDFSARVALETRIQQVVAGIAGAPADEIVLAPLHATPKTSSGKVRRSAAKELYLGGRIGARPRAPWRQILRLSLAGVAPTIRRLFRISGETFYATWWWAVVASAYLAAWLAVMALPRLAWRWRAVRLLARGALRALGAPASVAGIERIPPSQAMLVFNHSSYVDVALLAAVLPGEPVFVAKQELAEQLFAGPFTRRLGAFFVERGRFGESLAEVQALVATARQGRNIVFFPEGTFSRRAALAEFHLGAFQAAAEAGMPVLPGILRGTRSMLRGDQWFPRRAALSVEIGEAIMPKDASFAAVVELRDRTRQAILAKCGEPDLGELTIVPP